MTAYIFIAHKPDSEDYCRGCLMARYSGDFVHEQTDDLERLAVLWSECLFKNQTLDCNETGYDVIIYGDGRLAYEQNDGGFKDAWVDYDAEDWRKQEQEQARIQQQVLPELGQVLERAKLLAGQKLSLQQAAKRAKQEREQQEEQARRRAQFEKLRKEFDPPDQGGGT